MISETVARRFGRTWYCAMHFSFSGVYLKRLTRKNALIDAIRGDLRSVFE